MRSVEQQLPLIPEKPILSRPVDLTYIPVLKCTADALDYACRLANVVPKAICPLMECDKTVWSRICSGELDLDGRDIPRFNKVVGNSAYLMYLNYVDGWDLASMRKAQDDKDRRIAQLEQELADRDRAMALWVSAQRVAK